MALKGIAAVHSLSLSIHQGLEEDDKTRLLEAPHSSKKAGVLKETPDPDPDNLSIHFRSWVQIPIPDALQ